MKHILSKLNNMGLNQVHNFQMDSLSISYETDFLKVKGAETTVAEGTNAAQIVVDEPVESDEAQPVKSCEAPPIPGAGESCDNHPVGSKPITVDDERRLLHSWTNPKTGFIHQMWRWTFNGNPENTLDMENVVNANDEYIGEPDTAQRLYDRGIKPQLADSSHSVCSIGYCERENKWYGWSHRALFGFGIGSSVKKGDSGFAPATKEDFIKGLEAWHNDTGSNKTVTITPTDKGANVHVDYHKSDLSYDHDEDFNPGKGEWQANTLKEAREMAVNFAESVSIVSSDMLSSESAKQFSPVSYVWYTFTGRKTKEIDHPNIDISISLATGEKFGIYFNTKTNMIHFVESEAMQYEFRLEPRKMKAWLKKAKGFGGKVNGVKVTRGNLDLEQLKVNKLAKKGVSTKPVHIESVQDTPVKVKTKGKGKSKVVIKVVEPSFDTQKSVFVAYFKPNAEIEKYLVVVSNTLPQLKKDLKVRVASQRNLGSEPKILEIDGDHRTLSKLIGRGWGFLSGAHILILVNSARKVKAKIEHVRVGNEDIQMQERSKGKLELLEPIFEGNDIAVLKELRTEVITNKKLSGNMTLRPNTSGKIAGFHMSKGIITLEFILPNDSKKSNIEANSFVRRLKSATKNKLMATVINAKVDKEKFVTVLVAMNTPKFSTADQKALAKRIRNLEKNDSRADAISAKIDKQMAKVADVAQKIIEIGKSIKARQKVAVSNTELRQLKDDFAKASSAKVKKDLEGKLNILTQKNSRIKESASQYEPLQQLRIELIKANANRTKLQEAIDEGNAKVEEIRAVGKLDPNLTYNLNPSTEPPIHVNFDHIDYKKPAIMVRIIRAGTRAKKELLSLDPKNKIRVDLSLIQARQLYTMDGKVKIV